jgi:hypothetical protein
MVEATANTTVSTGGVWAIVIVASIALVVWLASIFLADRSQVRASGPGPSSRTTWVGGSVPGQRAEPVPPGEMPTRTDLPAQSAPTGPGAPRPRSGEADRAARSHATPDRPDGEASGR